MEVWKVDPLDPKNYLTLVKTFKAHNGIITDFCQVRLSNLLATSSIDGLIRIWDFENFDLITELKDLNSRQS